MQALLKSLWLLLLQPKTFTLLSNLFLNGISKFRVKPVLSPSVQNGQSVTQMNHSKLHANVELYQVDAITAAELISQACSFIMASNLPRVEKFLLVILLRNGLRVSEICNTGNIRVLNPYQVLVYCTKNKVWRHCTTGESCVLFNDSQLQDDLQIWKRNRQYYYRCLKGLLPGVETSRIMNQAVTHAARNLQAQQTFEATGSTQATRASIGNTSDHATKRYIKREHRKVYQQGGVIASMSGSTGSVTVSKNKVIRARKSNT